MSNTAKDKIIAHLKKIQKPLLLWQSCEHCGSDFLSDGETLCQFCIAELPTYFAAS